MNVIYIFVAQIQFHSSVVYLQFSFITFWHHKWFASFFIFSMRVGEGEVNGNNNKEKPSRENCDEKLLFPQI